MKDRLFIYANAPLKNEGGGEGSSPGGSRRQDEWKGVSRKGESIFCLSGGGLRG